ncbi:type II toxin-antitoxin system HipA family toxin [Hydrogenophaga soli]
MSRIVRQLRVALHDVPVGTLTLDDRGGTGFSLLDTYRHMHPRPVLGQQFEDDDGRKPRYARNRLPSWFSNLLPEGGLRQLMERHHGSQEFELLARSGGDLPGAVRVWELALDGSEALAADVQAEPAPPDSAEGDVWHFSLAGEQLKFSATSSDRGMTIPVAGLGGDWILKLPHPRYPKVPENEFATMQWARASGLEVPDIRLVDLSEVTGLPAKPWPPSETVAFAIRRFDRQPSGGRVHMEDFAQVLGLYPGQKYDKCNCETLVNMVWVMTGQEGLREMVRRLVFMLASGNGDAHLKNWSLLYPSGVHARLSPAYDLVSTIQYHDDRLALNFGKSKQWADVRMDTFRRLALRIGVDDVLLTHWVQEAVSVTRHAWSTQATDFGFDADAQSRLTRHMAQVPVLSAA